jgi:hypothetical protein
VRQWIGSHLSFANVFSLLALFVALGGTTYAATGGRFILGQPNTASSKSTLSAPIADKALTVTNTSNRAGATALGLNVASGHPPFRVNSPAKVANLNADQLDGRHASDLVGSVFTSRFRNTGTGSVFGPVTGIGPQDAGEDIVQQVSPAVPIVARDLVGRYDRSLDSPSGGTRSFTLRVNGASTALTCTLTRPAQSCSNKTARVRIEPGSLLSILFTQGGHDVGGGDVVVGWRATVP